MPADSPPDLLHYRRQIQLPEVGAAGQARLAGARVLVVGAGGLGCPVLLYLAAAGVGTLGLADADRVETHNLPRQTLYGTADVGALKVEAAARALAQLNETTNLKPHPVRVTLENVRALVSAYDLVVDGSDNFPTRYLLSDACVSAGRPLVSGAIYRFEGQVSVFNYQGGPTYRCLFPTPPGAAEAPDCNVTGVLNVLPGLVGLVQATEALKVLLNLGEVLSGRLWLLDVLSFQTRLLRFRRDPERSQINLDTADPTDYFDPACEPPAAPMAADSPLSISADELRARLVGPAPPLLLDVRRPDEFARQHLPGSVPLPLAGLAARAPTEVPRDRPVVVVCQGGARSAQAARLLRDELGFADVRSLVGGLNEYLND